jgi:hypothetical protein
VTELLNTLVSPALIALGFLLGTLHARRQAQLWGECLKTMRQERTHLERRWSAVESLTDARLRDFGAAAVSGHEPPPTRMDQLRPEPTQFNGRVPR